MKILTITREIRKPFATPKVVHKIGYRRSHLYCCFPQPLMIWSSEWDEVSPDFLTGSELNELLDFGGVYQFF